MTKREIAARELWAQLRLTGAHSRADVSFTGPVLVHTCSVVESESLWDFGV